MEETAQLMKKQFQIDIKVAMSISTTGFRILDTQVIFFLVQWSTIGHWVCLHYCDQFRKIQIYDSCSKTNEESNDCIQATVKQFFGEERCIELMSSPQQVGNTHCGLFAIANAICICKGHDPPYSYNQKSMLLHLKTAIEKGLFLELL